MTTLSGQSVSIIRGDRCLCSDLAFSVDSGELLLIEGPNGSGKTSLLRGISGLLTLDTGELTLNGVPVTQIWQSFRGEIIWLSHRVGFKADLNLWENLAFEKHLRSTSNTELRSILKRLDLDQIATLPFGFLSAGQGRRAGLARLLMGAGRIWILDEPLTNLDASGQSLVQELITEHLTSKGICIAASHAPLEVDARTHRIKLG